MTSPCAFLSEIEKCTIVLLKTTVGSVASPPKYEARSKAGVPGVGSVSKGLRVLTSAAQVVIVAWGTGSKCVVVVLRFATGQCQA